MRQNYFAVITAPKVPAPALTPSKCEDGETQKWKRREREENEKRSKRDREELRAGGKERRARLAAGGSNCVINLKVRFSREREDRGRERGVGQRGKKKREKERATSECCRSVFAAESAYSFAAPYIPAKRQRGYGIAGKPPRTHP